MCNSYMRISRDILNWAWYKDSVTFHVFFHLLINAQFKDVEYRDRKILRGQILTGRRELSKELNISERSIRTALNHLKSTNNITIESTNKFSIITICNFDSWQCLIEGSDQQKSGYSDQQPTSNRPATDQQPTTYYKCIDSYNDTMKDNEPSSLRSDGLPHSDAVATQPTTFRGQVIAYFNEKMKNKSIRPIRAIIEGKDRAKWLRARLNEYGRDAIFQMIDKAADSSFLNGHNRKGWTATFDWLIRPNNFPKVLEGNFDDDKITETIIQLNDWQV